MTWTKGIETKVPDPTSEWDKLTFGQTVCPGTVTVSVKLSADIDKRKPKGVKKSTAIDRGAKPAEVDVEVILLPSEFERFRKEIVPLVFSGNKTEAQGPLEMTHPALEMWNLHLFIVTLLTMPPPQSGGTLTVSFSAMEYVQSPAEAKVKQPIKTTPAVGTGFSSDTPRNKVDQLFERGG
jgi:hypothetical protein